MHSLFLLFVLFVPLCLRLLNITPHDDVTGYSAGESPLPFNLANCSVKDFGARGDGITDDTKAFVAAIKAMSNNGGGVGGVIYIPPGDYLI